MIATTITTKKNATQAIKEHISILDHKLRKLGAEAVHAAVDGNVDHFNSIQAKCEGLEALKAGLVARIDTLTL
jgi:hypothetical protein